MAIASQEVRERAIAAYEAGGVTQSQIASLYGVDKARTFDALLDAIANALQTITPADTRGWFSSCNYPASQT